jgi:3-methyladenine DNA glycosylase AlkD
VEIIVKEIMEKIIINQIKKDLYGYANLNRKKINERFFKTDKGGYAQYDKFLGISNPDIRIVAKKYQDCNLSVLQKIINSQYNEERLCALIILVEQFKVKNISQKNKVEIYNFYIKNLKYVNDWNLVDISAQHILGEYLYKNKKDILILDKLAESNFHWNRRVCIISTLAFIKRNEFEYTLRFSKMFLKDREDLMHKAVGWMLREIWKRDNQICEVFLIDNYDRLPRVTLRYAIERMQESKRQKFLKRKF